MELTIHTYGYADALYYVLNGLALFRNSSFYTTLINSVAILVGCYLGVRMAYSNSYSQIRQYVLKGLGMLVLVNALLLPTAEMLLKDHVSKTIQKVDNIPIAFALPVGLLEEFGHLLTIGFEQVFAPIEAAVNPADSRFSYYNYGMLFGARLKKEVSQARIKNPEFVGNMRGFIRQCVTLPAMIGHKFTKEQLVATDNMWGLVSRNAGVLTRVDVMQNGRRTTLSCKEAAEYFERFWQEENQRFGLKYQETDFGRARNTQNYGAPPGSLTTVFERNVKALYAGGKPASDILRQQMMINSLSDYRSSGFGVARSRMQQESSALLSSDLATLYLPMMLVVFKCIVYAAFIFLAPMLVLSGGLAKYGSYLTLAGSLQLWPALNSILNLIMGTFSNLPNNSNLLVSFSTAASSSNNVDTIVTIAGGLQILVPFLAFWITNMGIGGISHLAGNIVGGLTSASGAIGSELASGNRSLDNINEGNIQRNMRSANKTDYNSQYVDGASGYQHADGTMERVQAGGSVIFTGGAGATASVGSTRYTNDESRHSQVTNGVQRSEAMHQQNLRSWSDSRMQTFSRTADFVAHLAQREHSGESFNYDAMGEQGRALQQAVNHTRQLHDKHGYGWNQSGQMVLKGSLSVKPPLGKVAKFLTGVDASVGVEGAMSASNSSDQSVGDDVIVNRDNHTNESYNNIVKASTSASWAKENNIDHSYSEALRNSYEEQKRFEAASSISQQQVEDWHQAQAVIDSQGASSSKDMYQEVLNACVVEFGMDAGSVQRMVDRGHPDVMKVWRRMQQEDGYVSNLVAKIGHARQQVSGRKADKALADFAGEHQAGIKDEPGHRVKEHAKQQGFDAVQVQGSIKQQQANLEQKRTDLAAENATQYGAVKQHNEMVQGDLLDQTKKYEEDRIGKGRFVGQPLGIGAPIKRATDLNLKNNGAYQNAKQTKDDK